MPDWSTEIRELVGALNLPPAREAEISEELSQHVSDRYEEALARGASAEEAGRIAASALEGPALTASLSKVLSPERPAPVPGHDARGGFAASVWRDLAPRTAAPPARSRVRGRGGPVTDARDRREHSRSSSSSTPSSFGRCRSRNRAGWRRSRSSTNRTAARAISQGPGRASRIPSGSASRNSRPPSTGMGAWSLGAPELSHPAARRATQTSSAGQRRLLRRIGGRAGRRAPALLDRRPSGVRIGLPGRQRRLLAAGVRRRGLRARCAPDGRRAALRSRRSRSALLFRRGGRQGLRRRASPVLRAGHPCRKPRGPPTGRAGGSRWSGVCKPGWTVERASAQLATISPGIFEATVPEDYDATRQNRYKEFRLGALPGATGWSSLREDYSSPLTLLLALSGLRTAHRVRQPGQLDARALGGAGARDRRAAGARRLPRPADPPASCREPASSPPPALAWGGDRWPRR